MQNENCEDYDGYKKRKGKPPYVQKGLRRVWPEDAIMEGKLKCLDEAHSKYQGMRAADQKQLEKDLIEYALSDGKPLCYLAEREVLTCLKGKKNISSCKREIDRFLSCVDSTVSQIYQSDAARLRRINR